MSDADVIRYAIEHLCWCSDPAIHEPGDEHPRALAALERLVALNAPRVAVPADERGRWWLPGVLEPVAGYDDVQLESAELGDVIRRRWYGVRAGLDDVLLYEVTVPRWLG